MSKSKRTGGQGTPATVALTQAKVDFTLHPYEHDANAQAYGEEAADALGVPYEQIFKTLVAEVESGLAVAVVPVAGKLDLKAFAAALKSKRAAMADAAKVERVTGYVVGGISPLGQRKRLPTVIDASALRLRDDLLLRRTARAADRDRPLGAGTAHTGDHRAHRQDWLVERLRALTGLLHAFRRQSSRANPVKAVCGAEGFHGEPVPGRIPAILAKVADALGDGLRRDSAQAVPDRGSRCFT